MNIHRIGGSKVKILVFNNRNSTKGLLQVTISSANVEEKKSAPIKTSKIMMMLLLLLLLLLSLLLQM